MKNLNIQADIQEIGIAMNGDIMCEVLITYKTTWGAKRARAVHSFNISKLMAEWNR